MLDIKSATFISSYVDHKKGPPKDRPEFAFIGRSNVGKSSLINMLCNEKGLAKVSGTPGKTQTVNFFEIDNAWYLVDLPGFGYARVSQKMREKFDKMIKNYLSKRESLVNTFCLIDITIPPQKIDLEFLGWLGENGIPFSIVFTKSDRIGKQVLAENIEKYHQELLKNWEELPPIFSSSSKYKYGRQEILAYINEIFLAVIDEFKN